MHYADHELHHVEHEQHEGTSLMAALRRMEDAHLPITERLDAGQLIRQAQQRRDRVMGELQAMAADLAAVADILHRAPDLPLPHEERAREEIAVSFADGAHAVEQARESLEKATRDLEYLRYTLL